MEELDAREVKVCRDDEYPGEDEDALEHLTLLQPLLEDEKGQNRCKEDLGVREQRGVDGSRLVDPVQVESRGQRSSDQTGGQHPPNAAPSGALLRPVRNQHQSCDEE